MKTNKFVMLACLAAICGSALCGCDNSNGKDASSAAAIVQTTEATTDTTAETTNTTEAAETSDTTEAPADTTAAETAAPAETAAQATKAAAEKKIDLFAELVFDNDCSQFFKDHPNYEKQNADFCTDSNEETFYNYDGFQIYARFIRKENKEIIWNVDITSPDYPTPQGVKVGMTKAEVEKLVTKDHVDSLKQDALMFEFHYNKDTIDTINVYSTNTRKAIE